MFLVGTTYSNIRNRNNYSILLSSSKLSFSFLSFFYVSIFLALLFIILLDKQYFIFNKLAIINSLYIDKNLVPIVIYIQKSGDKVLSKKKKTCY